MATAFKQIKNNAKSIVALNALNNTTTTLSFDVEDGSEFPSINVTTPNPFYVTVWNIRKYFDPSDDPNMRIGLCTARSGNALTVTWGQEGTPIVAITGRPVIALLVLDKNLQDAYDAINLLEVGKQPLDADLTSLANLSTTGFLSRTGSGTTATRTFTAGSSKVTIGFPDGVSNNPVIDIADASSTQKGAVQLAGDLTGTASLPNVIPATFATAGKLKKPFYNIFDNGAVADAKMVSDASMTAGSAVLTSATAAFVSTDVGKIVTVANAGTSTRFTGVTGPTLSATISTYQSASQVTLSVAATNTVSNAVLKFGTDNRTAIANTVSDAIAAKSGYVFIPSGSFMVGSAIPVNASNINIIGSGIGITTLVLAYDGSAGSQNGSTGMIGFGASAAINTSNVGVRQLSIDMNSFTGNAIHWRNATSNTGTAQNCVIDTVEFYGRAPDNTGSTGCIRVTSDYNTVLGKARGLYINNCIFRDAISNTSTYRTGFSILICSDSISDVYITNNTFANTYDKTINAVSSRNTPRLRRNWVIDGNSFYNTVGAYPANYFGFGVGDFTDDYRLGFNGIKIMNNHFESIAGNWYLDGTGHPPQYYNITVYQSNGCMISNNTFKNGCSVLAPGYNTNYDNNLYSNHQSTFGYIFSNNIVTGYLNFSDPDSNIAGKYVDNVFIDLILTGYIGGYGTHYPSVYDGNLFVNCGKINNSDSGTVGHSIFTIQDGGNVIQNNVIYNDPIFPTPAAPTTATNGAGNLTGTYTYKVTFVSAMNQESASSVSTAPITVSGQQIRLTNIPTGPAGTEGRNVYRTVAGGAAGTEVFVTNVNGNVTTSYTDNITDANLVSSHPAPTVNQTLHSLNYIFSEAYAGIHADFPNIYKNNHIYGGAVSSATFALEKQFQHIITGNTGLVESTIRTVIHNGSPIAPADLNSTDIIESNWTSTGQKVQQYFDMGLQTGTFAINRINGETLKILLGGNITPTLSTGYPGQRMLLQMVQDGTGSRTFTPPANFKKAAGTLTLSTAPNALDLINTVSDGINWYEVSRSLNVS